jgi:hypothetical protein
MGYGIRIHVSGSVAGKFKRQSTGQWQSSPFDDGVTVWIKFCGIDRLTTSEARCCTLTIHPIHLAQIADKSLVINGLCCTLLIVPYWTLQQESWVCLFVLGFER